MRDYEYMYSMALLSKLKRRIRGKIFVEVNNHDEMIIKICEDENNQFVVMVNNFAEKFMDGYPCELICNDVMKLYKSHIIKQHFYTN